MHTLNFKKTLLSSISSYTHHCGSAMKCKSSSSNACTSSTTKSCRTARRTGSTVPAGNATASGSGTGRAAGSGSGVGSGGNTGSGSEGGRHRNPHGIAPDDVDEKAKPTQVCTPFLFLKHRLAIHNYSGLSSATSEWHVVCLPQMLSLGLQTTTLTTMTNGSMISTTWKPICRPSLWR